jgi:hypothetical protein
MIYQEDIPLGKNSSFTGCQGSDLPRITFCALIKFLLSEKQLIMMKVVEWETNVICVSSFNFWLSLPTQLVTGT